MIARNAGKTPWEHSPWRIATFIGISCAFLLALIARLVQVQLFEGAQYRSAAQANQVRLIPVAAPRGLIYDRNGAVLVRSRPSFVVGLIPSEIKNIDSTLNVLASAIDVPETTLRHRLLHHRGVNYSNFAQVVTYEPYGPVLLANDLQVATVAQLSELLTDLPGVDVEVQPVRDYPMGTRGSHLFGYVGAISEEEYASLKAQGYSPNDAIGKDGLEVAYDNALRGEPGGRRIVVDAAGMVVPKSDLATKPSIPGDGLVLNMDWRLQNIVETALKEHLDALSHALGRRISGAVVVEDPWNGGILALASYPNFDPNDFVANNGKRIAYYLTDPSNPLYNNAIAAETPTGSTFKMVTGTAAITEHKVTTKEVVYDSGGWNCGGYYARDIAAGGLGNTTFIPALAASSDGYFYQMSWRLGNTLLRKWALLFGLDSKTGIDLPGEARGNWPTNAWMLRNTGLPLEPSDVCFLGIGQGAMQATPLQMVNVASALINGGTLYRPRVVDRIVDLRGHTVRRFAPVVIRHIPASREALASERAGMSKVTDPGGTAYGLGINGLPFSGKTGTAETAGGAGPNTTWFIAWAPSAHPKLAMAVYVDRSGGYGASIAAPIAREVLVQYFKIKE
jgi:penicillin-binding protein 2